MSEANNPPKGLIADVRPGGVDVSGQQKELFPFDAFEYSSEVLRPGAESVLGLKSGWKFQLSGSLLGENSLSSQIPSVADVAEAQQTIADIMDDGKVTPSEKIVARRLWREIEREETLLDTQSTKYGVATTTLDEARTALNTYLNTAVTGVLADLTTTTDIVRATWDDKWNDYYEAKLEFLAAIDDELDERAATEASAAELAAKNNLAAQLGYGTYADMVSTVASVGKVVTTGGLLEADIVDAEALVARAGLIDALFSKTIQILTGGAIHSGGFNSAGNNPTGSGGIFLGADGTVKIVGTIQSGSTVPLATVDGAGTLAAQNDVTLSQVTDAGTLASKDTVAFSALDADVPGGTLDAALDALTTASADAAASGVAYQTGTGRLKIYNNGSIEAEDGIFRGTVFATDGSFTGAVYAAEGFFTGNSFSDRIMSDGILVTANTNDTDFWIFVETTIIGGTTFNAGDSFPGTPTKEQITQYRLVPASSVYSNSSGAQFSFGSGAGSFTLCVYKYNDSISKLWNMLNAIIPYNGSAWNYIGVFGQATNVTTNKSWSLTTAYRFISTEIEIRDVLNNTIITVTNSATTFFGATPNAITDLQIGIFGTVRSYSSYP